MKEKYDKIKGVIKAKGNGEKANRKIEKNIKNYE